ncbi:MULTISPECIES: hypothetical protein [Paenarthrobacter]|uniref:hypothetical protein n=1 Tax=Paenarthrobacter TaxID=1742992 RepID=UPI002118D0D7|nr:hypothetical protein [Paenarthrobacter nitroguajacolicus]
MAPGTRTSFAVRSKSARRVPASKGCNAAEGVDGDGEVGDGEVGDGDDAGVAVDDVAEGAGGPELQETVATTPATTAAVNAALTETCTFRVMATPVERY